MRENSGEPVRRAGVVAARMVGVGPRATVGCRPMAGAVVGLVGSFAGTTGAVSVASGFAVGIIIMIIIMLVVVVARRRRWMLR